jgi:predicted lipoprotein with Yx(FWY)xxD motif
MDRSTISTMHLRGRLFALALVAGLLLAALPAFGGAQEGDTVQWADHPDFGQILVASDGMTLYIFTQDGVNESNCADDCLANWPPLTVDEGVTPSGGPGVTGTLDTFTRDDTGELQVSLDGQPLYFWAADQAPGDTTGHEVGGVWFVIQQEVAAAPAPADAPADDDEADAADDEVVTPAAAGSGGFASSTGGTGALAALLALGVVAITLVARRTIARR